MVSELFVLPRMFSTVIIRFVVLDKILFDLRNVDKNVPQLRTLVYTFEIHSR